MGINYQHNTFLKITGTIIPLILTLFIVTNIGRTCAGEGCMFIIILFPLVPLTLVHLVIALIRLKTLDKWDIFFFFILLVLAVIFLTQFFY